MASDVAQVTPLTYGHMPHKITFSEKRWCVYLCMGFAQTNNVVKSLFVLSQCHEGALKHEGQEHFSHIIILTFLTKSLSTLHVDIRLLHVDIRCFSEFSYH